MDKLGVWLIGARGPSPPRPSWSRGRPGGRRPAHGCVIEAPGFPGHFPALADLVFGGHDVVGISAAEAGRAAHRGGGRIPRRYRDCSRRIIDAADAEIRPGYFPARGDSGGAAELFARHHGVPGPACPVPRRRGQRVVDGGPRWIDARYDRQADLEKALAAGETRYRQLPLRVRRLPGRLRLRGVHPLHGTDPAGARRSSAGCGACRTRDATARPGRPWSRAPSRRCSATGP